MGLYEFSSARWYSNGKKIKAETILSCAAALYSKHGTDPSEDHFQSLTCTDVDQDHVEQEK